MEGCNLVDHGQAPDARGLGSRRGVGRDREEPDLHHFLHGLAHCDLTEAEVVADFRDCRAGPGRDDDLPPLAVDDDFGTRQLGRQADPHVDRRHDGLDLLPLDEEVLGLTDQRLDVARRAGLGGRDVGLEHERSLVLAKQLEDDRDGRVAGLGVVRRGEDDPAAVEPDVADAAVAAHPEATRLVRGREEPKDVDQRKRVERAL